MRFEHSPWSWLICTLVMTIAFWTCFGACVDTPMADDPPQAKIVASWDPLQCGAPHRVAVALADDAGTALSSSTICETGGLTLDAPHLGTWHGRIYAWTLGVGEHATEPVTLAVDEPIVRWQVDTPR
ncbi:MAG: hypothetical protein ABI467_15915 [Kofleriaceae bacterium]